MPVSILVSHRVLTPEKVVRSDHGHLCCYQSGNGGGCDPLKPDRYRATPMNTGIGSRKSLCLQNRISVRSKRTTRAKAPQKGAFFIYFKKSLKKSVLCQKFSVALCSAESQHPNLLSVERENRREFRRRKCFLKQINNSKIIWKIVIIVLPLL
jgi:hypothetical protein